MRWVLLLALLSGCGGSQECEEIRTVPFGDVPNRDWYYEMTCIHECGAVLRMSYWIPGPSCEWERRVCGDHCAGARP